MSSNSTRESSAPYGYLFLTGLIAGVLDFTAAEISFLANGGNDLTRIPIFIASGIFGKGAFEGNAMMPVLGTLFHFIIAQIWTLIFFFLFPIISRLLKNKYLIAAAYGTFVWFMMNLVVLPLSNTPPATFRVRGVIIGMSILMLCIGLPISLMIHRYFRKAEEGK